MLGNNIEHIPDGWSVANIEDIADIKTGSGDTQDKEEDGKYPFYVRSNTIERVNDYSFDGEGVLTSGDGVGVGKIYHYVNGKIHYHQRVYNIHNFKKNVLGRYFYEYFSHNFYSRVMRMSAKGSVDSVRLDMIAKMNVLLPPVEEQEKIADILSSVNLKINLIDKKIKHTEELTKGLLQKLFTEGVGTQDKEGSWYPHVEFKECSIGELPNTWRVCKISDVAEINPKRPNIESDELIVSFIGMSDVSEDAKLISSHNKTYLEVKKGFTPFLEQDILVAKITPCFENGKGALTKGLANGVGFGSTEFHVIRTNETIVNPKYLYYITKSYQFRIKGEMNMTGTAGQKRVPTNFIKNYEIAIPPLQEQVKITDILDSNEKKSELLIKQRDELKLFKKGLMQKLLTGKWRVNPDKVTAKQVALEA